MATVRYSVRMAKRNLSGTEADAGTGGMARGRKPCIGRTEGTRKPAVSGTVPLVCFIQNIPGDFCVILQEAAFLLL